MSKKKYIWKLLLYFWKYCILMLCEPLGVKKELHILVGISLLRPFNGEREMGIPL